MLDTTSRRNITVRIPFCSNIFFCYHVASFAEFEEFIWNLFNLFALHNHICSSRYEIRDTMPRFKMISNSIPHGHGLPLCASPFLPFYLHHAVPTLLQPTVRLLSSDGACQCSQSPDTSLSLTTMTILISVSLVPRNCCILPRNYISM